MLSQREAFVRNKLPRVKPPRPKAGHVGVPAIFKLEMACNQIREAFCGGEFGDIYHVGSSLDRPDWRDVDIVCILGDCDFAKLFPDVLKPEGNHGYFEHDPRWLMLTIMLSDWLTKQAGVPVDFKFQPMTFANTRHAGGRRNAMAMRFVKE